MNQNTVNRVGHEARVSLQCPTVPNQKEGGLNAYHTLTSAYKISDLPLLFSIACHDIVTLKETKRRRKRCKNLINMVATGGLEPPTPAL